MEKFISILFGAFAGAVAPMLLIGAFGFFRNVYWFLLGFAGVEDRFQILEKLAAAISLLLMVIAAIVAACQDDTPPGPSEPEF